MFAEYHDLIQKRSYTINVDKSDSGHLSHDVPIFFANAGGGGGGGGGASGGGSAGGTSGGSSGSGGSSTGNGK